VRAGFCGKAGALSDDSWEDGRRRMTALPGAWQSWPKRIRPGVFLSCTDNYDRKGT